MKGRMFFVAVSILAIVLVSIVPVASAKAPDPIIPAVPAQMQPYVDALVYWLKSMGYSDWEVRAGQMLKDITDQANNVDLGDVHENTRQSPGSTGERVYLTGVPESVWWIDVWRLDLNGKWSKMPSMQPGGVPPEPVTADLSTQGKMPGIYVVRVCDKTGAVLLEAPRVILVSWTKGSGGTWQQIFDLANMPKPTETMLASIKM